MEEFPPRMERSPWTQVVFTLLVALAGFIIIGPMIGLFMAFPFYDGTAMTFLEDLSAPLAHPEIKLPLFIVQGAATFIGLALIPAFFHFKSRGENIFRQMKSTDLVSLMLISAVMIFFMAFNSVFVQWNSSVQLPDFLKGFEQWAREKEDLAMQVTQFLTTFNSFGEFMIGLVVIAIFPAIGEELVFRGLLQPELNRATRNAHAAIWISAFLFSALHMQFFGFFPRLLLGALLGYLYFWSGNLLVPVLGHLVNNGFIVVMMYLKKSTLAGMDIEGQKAAPWPVVLLFTAITAALLLYFRKSQLEKQSLDNRS